MNEKLNRTTGVPAAGRAALSCLILLAGLAARGQTTTPSLASTRPATLPARSVDLLSHGSSERLWYVYTTPAGSNLPTRSVVRERDMQSTDWRLLAPFSGRVLALADLRGQLVASLEDGEWKRIAPEQFASGPPLPGGGDLLALAGDGATLWAVGFAGGARPVPDSAPAPGASQPASSRAATQSTGPTTRPEQLQLYRFSAGVWTHLASLPASVRASNSFELSMIVLNNAPLIAYKDEARLARVIRFVADKSSWARAGSISAGFPIRKLSLATSRDKVIGWAVGEAGVGAFFFPTDTAAREDHVWRVQELSVPAGMRVMDASIAAARDELHLFVIRENEDFYEQKYDLSGKLTPNSLAKLSEPQQPEAMSTNDVIHFGLLGLLMVVTLTAASRGGPVQIASIDGVEVALAPMPLRLAAGLIDLFPLYIAYAMVVFHTHNHMKPSQFYSDRFALWAFTLGLVVYFLHTWLGEWFLGRSVGKMTVGLRVVAMTGKPAPAGAILLRNLMRVIEVPGLAGVPLLVMLLNPLRQRLGDIAAGTMVVAKLPKTTKTLDERA